MGARVGFDPQLMSEELFKKYFETLECCGQILVAVTHNLVDIVWGSERPSRPTNPLLVLSTKYSGLLLYILCACQSKLASK